MHFACRFLSAFGLLPISFEFVLIRCFSFVVYFKSSSFGVSVRIALFPLLSDIHYS
jgi:hypothetical protein